jgi:transcriptional regulator with XRE-family HTH domain
MSLSARIAEKRRREGLSLRDAGRSSRVAFSTLGRIEAGAAPSYGVAQRIEAWLRGETPVLPPPPMTLLDYFAGQALGAMDISWSAGPGVLSDARAKAAYDIAEAILAERQKRAGK